MLTFILGRASSGKSYKVCRMIADRVRRGEAPVLIIPEQFSFESEKRILSLLGECDAQKVKVLSFSRLCDEIENIAGGGAGEPLSDPDKIIIMNTAMRSVKKELKYFGKYSLSPGFTDMMLNTVNEFIMNAVSPADIIEVAGSFEDSVLKRKLLDAALIYAAYNDLMAEKFPDSCDRLTRLYNTLADCDYFSGRPVFIDSFGGFTGQQYRIIDRILSAAGDLFVSFCENPCEKGTLGLFANIRRAKNRISALADKQGVRHGEDIILESGKYVSEGIAAVEEYMCLSKTEKQSGEALTVCRAETVYDEAQFAARNIRRIVRQTGARYNDFTVIARNAEDYEQVLSVAFAKNGVRCFSDKREPLKSFPPVTAAVTAMELSGRITTEKLLRFHKCGVNFLSQEEISELENYAYIWNIDGEAWKKEWNMDPAGIDGGGRSEEEINAAIARVNQLRLKALEPILNFTSAFRGGARNMAKATVALLESVKDSFIGISEKFKNSSDTVLSESIVTAYSKVMKILDSLVRCLESDVSPAEFLEAFKNSVGCESVGVIPQMVDEVTFGSAERIQPSRPSYVFILGANQGIFPRAPQASGIFAVSEIGKLIDKGIEISDCSVRSAVDEDMLVYNCVCCADKKVFISYNARAGEPAYFLKKLVGQFGVTVLNEPDKLKPANLPETLDCAYSRFCRADKDSSDHATLKSALSENDDYKDKVLSACESVNRPRFDIPRETAIGLVGKNIALSASKLEEYNKCAFRYFCKYALSVKKAEQVSFSPLQSGTFLHYVLQRFIEETRDRISEVKREESDELTERLVNEYLDSFKGYKEAQTPHLKLMVRYMTETLKFLCARLIDEFSQSDFKPEKCELYIGKGGEIPPLTIPVDGEVTAQLTGKVDRLDRYKGYVRIIDYKSNALTFELSDILTGQNVQMLIYLYAICRDERLGGEPGGIFYSNASLIGSHKSKPGGMNGFMPETEELITAMDKSGGGEFIGQKVSKINEDSPTAEDFREIFRYLEQTLSRTARDIANGRFGARPVASSKKTACDYCDFKAICRIENEKPPAFEKLSKTEAMELIRKQVSENEV